MTAPNSPILGQPHLPGIQEQVRADVTRKDNDNIAGSSRDSAPITVTLIKIDETILNHFANIIKPTVIVEDKQFPVPIVWGTPERWKTIRQDGFMRDQYQKLQVPVIMLRRSGVTKNPFTSPVNKYLSRVYETGWNRHNSYDKFTALNHISPSRELVSVTVPDYVDLQYEVLLWTEKTEQMNQLIEQINFEADEFWGPMGSFKFKVTIQDYTAQSDLPATSDRIIRSAFNMLVKAYLLPEKMQTPGALGPTSTTRKSYGIKKVIKFIEVAGTTSTSVTGQQ